MSYANAPENKRLDPRAVLARDEEMLAELFREGQEEWARTTSTPARAEDLRRRAEQGHDVTAAAADALHQWQVRADALVKRAATRQRQGKSLLASESRDLDRARRAAYELSTLLDDLQPQYRRPMAERLERNTP